MRGSSQSRIPDSPDIEPVLRQMMEKDIGLYIQSQSLIMDEGAMVKKHIIPFRLR